MVFNVMHSRRLKESAYCYMLPGISFHPLGSYLAGLGLLRLINRTIDPTAMAHWENTQFILSTEVAQDQLIPQLLQAYTAIHAFSPWHKPAAIVFSDQGHAEFAEGSIGSVVMHSPSPHVASLRSLLPNLLKIVSSHRTPESTLPDKEAKIALIRELLDRVVDAEWRDWADTAVVMLESLTKSGSTVVKPKYPALLGTGGNIMTSDIAGNYLMAVDEMFDLAVDRVAPKALAAAQLSAVLFGVVSEERLESDSVKALHLFPTSDYRLDWKNAQNQDYAKSGGTGGATINPTWILLATEGLLTFSQTISTINGHDGAESGKAIGRQLARYSLAVTTNGASIDLVSLDERKGFCEEYFLPLWSQASTHQALKDRLFESPLNSEEQFYLSGQVRDGLDFIQAIQQWTAARKISARLARYAMLPRKGQANFAVFLGLIEVGGEIQDLDLAADLNEDRRKLTSSARIGDHPAITIAKIYAFDRAFGEFIAGRGDRSELLFLLGDLSKIRGLSQLDPLRREWLDGLVQTPEFRLALALVSRKTTITQDWVGGNPIESLIELQRQWGQKEIHPSASFFANLKDISVFISGDFNDGLFERWVFALQLIDLQEIENNPIPASSITLAKLPSEYRLGVVYGMTIGYGKVDTIAQRGGSLEPLLARLMGKGIFARIPQVFTTVHSDRIAAAVAFPIGLRGLESILDKYFIREVSSA